jgi:uncharacterized membrane protein
MTVTQTEATRSARALEQQAKHAVTPAAGPYGHPFHPLLVTVPIGAWIGALVLDIGSRAADDGGALARGAYWMIGVGVVGALVAAVAGLLDLLAIPPRTRARTVGITHMLLNLAVVALFVVSFIWRADRGAEVPTNGWLFVLSGAALLLLSASGWLGGMLSYRYGVRVADEETQLAGFRRDRRDRREHSARNGH